MNRFAALFVLALVPLASASAATPAPADGFQRAAGCEGPPRPAEIYQACADQMQILARARAEAAAAGKRLLVIFGATWCPSCKSLQTALPQALARHMADGPLGGRIHTVEIAISTLARGKVVPVPSGEAVLAMLLATRPDVRQRAVPFLAVTDPASGHASLRNLDDLESRGAWNVAALADVIAAAEAAARTGTSAAGEPGWLVRKWRRWTGG